MAIHQQIFLSRWYICFSHCVLNLLHNPTARALFLQNFCPSFLFFPFPWAAVLGTEMVWLSYLYSLVCTLQGWDRIPQLTFTVIATSLQLSLPKSPKVTTHQSHRCSPSPPKSSLTKVISALCSTITSIKAWSSPSVMKEASWAMLTPSEDVLAWLLFRPGSIAVTCPGQAAMELLSLCTFAWPVTALLLAPCDWSHRPGLQSWAQWGYDGFLPGSH